MRHRLTSAFLALCMAGCATPYSDAANEHERKAYIACAVTRAFLYTGDASPEAVARGAMLQCEAERHAVLLRLAEENAGKPFAARFVASYMDTLHAAMLDHIALRLAQSRARGERIDSSGI